MKKVELLAPAKDKKAAIAAIDSGCDAIYIGASNFGARQNAANSLEDLKEIVEHAHKFNVKVHAAVNTILDDNELLRAQKLVENIYSIGIDAVIIQDMGLIELACRSQLPPVPIHASTQCDNRTLEKVKFFENIGVSRVILARELSIKQIEEICAATNIEIETFVHGALCVSYSGQCYMSCLNGGRSANRGECAQSCRKKYTLIDEQGKIIAKRLYLLSLRDFNASKHLKTLINAGVKSFKIEGRLKDENYVRNVVAYYRKEIDKYAQKTSSGKVFLDFEPDLSKSFNRGFTDYFLQNRKHCYNFQTPKSIGEKLGTVTKTGTNYFELKTDCVINPQDGLCYLDEGRLKGFLVNKADGNRVYPNKTLDIPPGVEIFRNFDAEFDRKLTNSKTKRRIGAKFLYNEGILHVIDEDGNEAAMEVAAVKAPKNLKKMKETFVTQLKKAGESDFYVTEVEITTELPFLPVSEINSLRRKLFEKLMEERLNNYKRDIQQPLKHVEFPFKELDYRANIHNTAAKEFYEACGCKVCGASYESSKPRNAELMRTKHCLKYAFDICQSPEKLFLVDEKGKKYSLNFDCKNCEMIVTF